MSEVRVPDERVALAGIDAPVATLLSVAVGLLIALGELDHLVAQVTNAEGESWSPTGLTSFGDWGETEQGWDFLASDAADRAASWLHWYGVLGLCLVGVYVVLLLRAGAMAFTGRSRVYLTLVAVGASADCLENAALWARAPGSWWLPAVSLLKWACLAGALALLLYAARGVLRGWVPLVLRALYTHRYSAVIVLPLAVLSLASGPDILEQVPDIQRRWADDGGLGDFVASAVVTIVLAAVAFVIGRLRSHHLWLRTLPLLDPDDRPLPSRSFWFAGPVLLVAAALLVDRQGADVAVGRLALFCAVPVVIGGVSAALRKWARLSRPQRARIHDPLQVRATALVGDLLPGILLIVAGLGAIRAFAAVVALDRAGGPEVAFLVVGAVTVVATWHAYAVLLRRLRAAGESLSTSAATRRRRFVALLTPSVEYVPDRPLPLPRRYWLSWSILGASVAGALLVAVFPVPLAERFGVIALFQACLGLLSVMVAAVVITQQPTGSPEIFWPVRLAYTPVTSLVVGACLIAALLGGGADVHGIRAGEGAAPDKDDVPTQFDRWLAAGGDCAQPLGDTGYEVRPMLLYAAEGGGIRAAYWTASGVDKVVDAAGDGREVCGSAFLSSGASGGAVGLSVASVADPGEARAAVRDISGPDPLAAAATGLVLRDTIFAATGVPPPSFGAGDGDAFEWDDRAELIEQQWEEAIPGLADPFVGEHADAWDRGPSGAMVLNSVSATTGCRTLISQVDLDQRAPLPGCTDRPPVAGSVDLERCLPDVSVSTAALLASRFPYVTPAGARSCAGVEQQIVDGGYAENTGIGTLMDLSPVWMALVRAHNSCVLDPPAETAVCEPAPRTLVVPLLLYFDNGSGSDLARATPEPLLELLVPPLANARADRSLASPQSQLQRAAAGLATDQLWESAPVEVTDAVDEWRGDPVVVMYQATEPGIAAPLGWVLSQASQDTMDDALRRRATGALDHGTIDDLTALIAPE